MGEQEGQASTKGRRFTATKRHRHAAAAALDPRPRAQVCVVDARLCQAPTDRDDQEPDLTGFYQEQGPGRPRYTMQINQAGDHLQIWVRQVLDSRYAKEEASKRRWMYYGRRPNGGSAFRLFVKPENWDCDDGELSGTPESVTFTGSGITGHECPILSFERCEGEAARRPVYAERVRLLLESDGSDDARKLLNAEYYRLPQYDVARIWRAAQSGELRRLLDAFLDQSNRSPDEWNVWQRRIVDLDNYVAHELFQRQRRAVDDFAVRAKPPEASAASWHESDLEAMYREVWMALRFHPHPRGEGGSMLGGLSAALSRRVEALQAPYGQAQDFVAIKQLLRLAEPEASKLPTYKYEFSFRAGEGGVSFVLGVKVRAGAVTVVRDGAILGRFDFAMIAGAAGLAAGGGLGNFKADVAVEARERWEAENLPGVLEFLEVGGEATVAGGGGEGKIGVIVVHGDGSRPPLNLDLTSADAKSPIPDPLDWAHAPEPPQIPDFKGELGVSASIAAGYLWGKGVEATKYLRRDVDEEPEEVTYVKTLSERQKVHFFEGDSRLTPWGRQVLGMFCADELRFLLDERCQVKIEGYTDPKGSDTSNKDLSEWRAQNVVQALMEIVGEGRLRAQLGVPEGHGEGPARRELPDRTDDPGWRNVNISLDHSVLLQLRTPRT